MAFNSEFQKQVQDWIEEQRNTLASQLASAQRNANVRSWGGTAADAAHWNRVAASHQSALDTLNNQGTGIMARLQAADIGPEGFQTVQKALQGDPIANQQLNEAQAIKSQLDAQNKQLADYRGQAEQQIFGGQGLSLSEALTSTGGDIGNLNRFLGEQQAETFNTQLKPLIQMALGAQGLSDSGAQVELQSKALADLEQKRQQSVMQAALGGRAQLQGIQRSDLLGGIGLAQQGMMNQFDLQRTGITMQFQQQLEQQREQLARELASRRGGAGGGGIGSLLGAGLGALGFFSSDPQIGLMGMGVGAGLGGALGSTIDPGYGNNLGQALGSSFFAGASMMPKAKTKSISPSGPDMSYGGPPTSPYWWLGY